MDDPLRLAAFERLARSASLDDVTDVERRLQTGLHFTLIPSKIAPASRAKVASA